MHSQVPFTKHNGHFINNTVSVPAEGMYLLITSFEKFQEIFGTVPVMGEVSYVTEDLFKTRCVLAVLKDHLAETSVHSVLCENSKLTFIYSSMRIETATWTAHTPIIISIPKNYVGTPRCTEFVFLNQEGYIAINAESAANNQLENHAGGWSPFRKIDGEAGKALKAALENRDGSEYLPFLYKTQVVAGTNYCFLCATRPVVPNAKWSELALVYVFKNLQGVAQISKTETILHLDDTMDLMKAVAEAEKGK